MDAETLSSKERHTLRMLADTFVRSIAVSPDPDGFYGRKASDLAVDEDVARIIERYLSPDQRADFRRLLRTIESPMANMLLSGRPARFSTESEAKRERFLLGWAHSRLGIKRQGFQAVKRLVLFLTYAKALDGGPGVQCARGPDGWRQLDDQLDDVPQASALGPGGMGAGVRNDRGGLAGLRVVHRRGVEPPPGERRGKCRQSVERRVASRERVARVSARRRLRPHPSKRARLREPLRLLLLRLRLRCEAIVARDVSPGRAPRRGPLPVRYESGPSHHPGRRSPGRRGHLPRQWSLHPHACAGPDRRRGG